MQIPSKHFKKIREFFNQDIGEVVAFLASVEPNFINGQAITVDGFQWIT